MGEADRCELNRKILTGSPQLKLKITMKILSKILNFVKQYQYQLFLTTCIILISFISYNLGKIDALEKSPLIIKQNASSEKAAANLRADIYSAAQSGQEANNQKLEAKILDTRVVVSKASSTKKYHYTWCSGAKKIKEENKIWFNSAQEAESRGYMLAGNCTN